MPLSMACPGNRVRISHITGRDSQRQHLAELGFVAGSEVVIVSKLAGNLLLSIKESRVALDQSLANRIHIEEVLA